MRSPRRCTRRDIQQPNQIRLAFHTARISSVIQLNDHARTELPKAAKDYRTVTADSLLEADVRPLFGLRSLKIYVIQSTGRRHA